MDTKVEVEAYWQEYLASLRGSTSAKSYEVWRFGDSEELANKLGPLVRSGKKTATSDLLWELSTFSLVWANGVHTRRGTTAVQVMLA
jgi:uncharacterized protein YhfF